MLSVVCDINVFPLTFGFEIMAFPVSDELVNAFVTGIFYVVEFCGKVAQPPQNEAK